MAQSKLPVRHGRERGVWNPVQEIGRLQNRIDRMFDDFFLEPVPSLFSSGDIFPVGEIGFTPACDLEETDTHYFMSFDLPGVKKDDVKIEIKDNQLIVSGERKEEHEAKEKGRVSRERSYGSFYRVFTLPSVVEPEKVQARYQDGVLQISVPKSPEQTAKQIQIQEGKLIEEKKEKAA